MTDRALGTLARVDLREIWTTEASDFTPWLAQPENLAVLGDTLGIDLELEAQEQAVGPFRADILCKDSDSEAWVLIENQLERTDHTHLGQLLTYASGLEAVVIVWIAAAFTEEHRATLDWLNRITDESFRFFALEVELWRIGESPAAPKFNVVAKPNEWSRSVARAARSIDETELSETRLMQRDYWEGLNAALDRANGPISGDRKPQLKSWMRYPIGRSGFSLGAAIAVTKRQVRTYLRIAGSSPKASFHLLREQADEIERELGCPLVWKQEPTGRRGRVSVYLDDLDPADEADWPRQHEWLATKLNDMHRVFAQRLRVLDPREWQPEPESDQDPAAAP
ncbi:MAG: DUF4268 domain-containing protein [Rhodospirillales bacterium]|nr:DUF4268 domain-containing protein [Rhodospirillales bacterium]